MCFYFATMQRELSFGGAKIMDERILSQLATKQDLGNYVTKEEFNVFKDDIFIHLDEHLTILKRLDQERIFTTSWLKRIDSKLDEHGKILRQHGNQINENGRLLEKHGNMLEKHGNMLEKHGRLLEKQENILEKHGLQLEKQSQYISEIKDSIKRM